MLILFNKPFGVVCQFTAHQAHPTLKDYIAVPDVYAAGIFELVEYGWKDRYVFNFNWRNFKSLKASFPYTPKNDFEVAMGESYFEILGMTAVDTTKLNDFLDAISLVEVDQYVNPEEVIGYDSLLAANPLMKVEVSDISGKTYSDSYVALFAGKLNVRGRSG